MRKLAVFLVALLPAIAAMPASGATPLVDVPWLLDQGQNQSVVILDIRNKLDGGSEEVYREGHIPGAIYSNYLTGGWRTTVDGVVGQLPPVADLEALIGGLGIGNDDHVVVVAAGVSALDMGSATRVYFTFKVLGHDAVSILDGGYAAYTADADNPIETGANSRAPKVFAAAFRPELLASREEVAAAAESGSLALLDHRPPDQFAGKKSHPKATRPGTIPSARNLPESELTDGGRFASAERVAALLQDIGVGADDPQVNFCNTGHWASLGWFASSELLGNKEARLYDGSMVDWSAQEDLPIEVQ